MTEDAKVVYQAVGKAAGVNVLFDPDYNSKRIQVDLNNVSLLDALRIVGTMSNTFWRPVTSNTIFVAQNTPHQAHSELDEQAVQTFYLTNAWQQNDLNDVQTALRNVMPTAKIYGVQSQNAIVMRGTPDELLLAQQLIDDLDKARGEVVVDIAVLEVSKNWERTLGISWPSSIGVALQPNCSASNVLPPPPAPPAPPAAPPPTSPTLYDLAHLNSTDFAVTVGSATLNLLLTDNNTKVLQSPRIRATDDQKATMKIGSRIPIATGSYQTGAATASSARSSTPSSSTRTWA
jgi:general secretion pathway protein D